jgi:hypothetical protein
MKMNLLEILLIIYRKINRYRFYSHPITFQKRRSIALFLLSPCPISISSIHPADHPAAVAALGPMSPICRLLACLAAWLTAWKLACLLDWLLGSLPAYLTCCSATWLRTWLLASTYL